MLSKGRIEYVDIAKSLALALVAYSHTPGPLWQVWLGSFFIAAFFFLSGFTSGTGKGIAAHVATRALRLLLPYVIFSTAFLILTRHFSFIDFFGVAYSRYSLFLPGSGRDTALLRSCNSPLWFLTAMFVADTLYYIIVRSYEKSNQKLLFTIATIAILLILTELMNLLPILLPWSIDIAPYFAMFMFLGHIARQTNVLKYGRYYFLPALVAYLPLCLLNDSVNLSVRHYGNSILLSAVTGLLGTLLLIFISQCLNRIGCHLLALFGRYTLVIFSIQLLVIRGVELTFSCIGITPDSILSRLALALLMIVLVFAVGFLSGKVLRKLLPNVF